MGQPGLLLAPAPPRVRGTKPPAEQQEPWYLATSLDDLGCALAWYRQRMRVEETFRDWHDTFGLEDVLVGSAARLGRLVAALSLAAAWLHLLALPGVGALPRGWAASVVTTAAPPSSRSPSPCSTTAATSRPAPYPDPKQPSGRWVCVSQDGSPVNRDASSVKAA